GLLPEMNAPTGEIQVLHVVECDPGAQDHRLPRAGPAHYDTLRAAPFHQNGVIRFPVAVEIGLQERRGDLLAGLEFRAGLGGKSLYRTWRLRRICRPGKK